MDQQRYPWHMKDSQGAPMDPMNSPNNDSPRNGINAPITVVRVKGTIHADLATWLEPVEVRFLDDGDTQLVYADLDQAGLYGLLVRLRDLGLSLVSVENKDK